MSARFFAANLSPETTRIFDAAPMPPAAERERGTWLWRTRIEHLQAGEILVPSLTIADGAPYGFRFSLETNEGCVALPGFGEFSKAPKALTSQHLSTHIDYFGVLHDIDAAFLVLELETESAPHQRPLLLGVSRRPARLDAATPLSLTTAVVDVPALSQRDAPAHIAMRICSPACVTMVMRGLGVGTTLLDVSHRAHHGPSGIYGAWPQNLYAASRDRIVGAVRTFDCLEEVASMISRGLAVVASLRYAKGELQGAPQEETDGHLMVVCGFDDRRVIVNDPIAATSDDVRRSYDLAEFGRIWLRERGAGYVMAPL